MTDYAKKFYNHIYPHPNMRKGIIVASLVLMLFKKYTNRNMLRNQCEIV